MCSSSEGGRVSLLCQCCAEEFRSLSISRAVFVPSVEMIKSPTWGIFFVFRDPPAATPDLLASAILRHPEAEARPRIVLGRRFATHQTPR